MDIYDLIHKRRSIRMFNPDPIDDEIIDRIMNAAIWAPSAFNCQNWKFYVLTGERRNKFAELLVPVFEQMKDEILCNYGPEALEVRRKLYTNAGNAPVVIACYIEQGSWEWDIIGPGMAFQNILLAATAEGLGSLFMGAPRYVQDSVNEFLSERNSRLMGAILIGYPDENPEPKERRSGNIIRKK